jgi:chitin disaccharide deacetylase
VKRLLVNADDFGLSPGANLGILRAHREGIVTSATIMVNMPAAPEAFRLAKTTPTLGVGLHITLTGGRPLSDAPSLTGPDGCFLKLPELAAQARPQELAREIQAQVDAFLAVGLRPTHLDSHHHVHLEIPAVGAIVARLGAELSLPVRATAGAPAFIDTFYRRERVTVERLLETLEALQPDTVSEIMCHPACLDPEILRGSRYALERVHELATLTDPRIRDAVASGGITLVNYRDLA